ncbi:winged helix-turn-helix domain-containing protein [Alteraurantiacibacter buctensis]|uniref:Transcriptional regulator n=1 Tax=Alteraurantiacibacter buctensis TaxID=1503981 RepID=A0A844Z348_9SPHN|nr:transcriptional regulator [Alteraurantiacibacter buctensis]MXO73401.1 transcriptional regulator [Alteraurantiacibacter buctensis]
MANPPMLHFGDFAFDPANRRLTRAGQPVDLGSRYFDALGLLLAHPGELVTKQRFMDEVWRGIPVTDEALTQCIRTLRRALGERAGAAQFIETVPKHGYRFVAEVSFAGAAAPLAVTQKPERQGGLAAAAAAGGGAAGALGGLAYGLLAGSGTANVLPVLAGLGLTLGVMGGAGVGLGMALARMLVPRSAAALVAGGTGGGMVAGAVGRLLGTDGIAVLTGARIGPVTGLLEGLVLGAAVALAVLLAARLRPVAAALAASLAGGLAGLLIALAGGRMLGGSLAQLQGRFPESGLAVGALASGPAATAATAAEAALFVSGIVLAEGWRARRAAAAG